MPALPLICPLSWTRFPYARSSELVALTQEGHDRVRRVREARRARYAGRLADWDPREVSELARLLHQLNAGMAK
jgi:DNA-binding MarR family transcriptional regulator